MIRRASGHAAVLTALLSVLLASTALTGTFTEPSYVAPVVSAVVVAFALGWVGRRLDVPATLAPAVSFVGFVEYLTVIYFRKHAFLGFVPTPDVFRAAGVVIKRGARDINELAAPVLPTSDLIFITVAGVFAAALVVDLIALRLRRPVLAGLPLLALFVIPSSLAPDGAGWISFALATAGYLALLTIEGRDRVHRWGRRLSATRHAVDDGYRRPVARAARGIGAFAIGFALVVPGLTPGLENGLLRGTGAATGNGSGGEGKGGGRTTISASVELRKQLNQSRERVLIRVRTDDEPQYLRMIVLDEFTGLEWKRRKDRRSNKDAKKEFEAPPGLTQDVEQQLTATEIQIGDDFGNQELPAPYSPIRITGLKGTWRYDDSNREIASSDKSPRGSTYTVESVVATPDPQQLDDELPYPAGIQPYVSLPTGRVDPSVIAQAKTLTEDESTNWGRVVALQNYFARNPDFVYSTTTQPGSGGDALMAFLRDKIGYCEQYAGAMAVMVRAIGLPSRVIIGFTPGTRVGDRYSITNKDAHAWPEVYFPTAGWVRFEPTPASGGDAVRPPPEALIIPTAEPTPSESASPSASSSAAGLTARPERPEPSLGPGSVPISDSGFATKQPVNRRPLLIALVVFLLALVPVVPAAARWRSRRRAWRDALSPQGRSHVAWRQLHDDAADLGFSWPVSASPRVAGLGLISAAHLLGEARAAVQRLAVAEENARYAPASYLPASTPDFVSDVAVVRHALLAAVPPRRRWRAVVFPASSLSEISRWVHVVSARAGTLTGRIADLVPARLRARSG